MKKCIAILALALVWGCKEEPKDAGNDIAANLKTYTIKQMMDNETVFGGSFSPNKSKLLISSNRSGIYNMYTVPTSGGDPIPVTASDSSSVFAVSYFPKDERMLFRMDNNGDEIFHIYLRDTDGKPQRPYPGRRCANQFLRLGKGTIKAFSLPAIKGISDIWTCTRWIWKTFKTTMLYQNDEGYSVGGLSDDKNYLPLSKSINTNDSDLFLYNLKDKSLVKINKNQSANSSQDFSIDNKSFYYTTDDGSEFSYLMRYDIANKSYEKALGAQLGHCRQLFYGNRKISGHLYQ